MVIRIFEDNLFLNQFIEEGRRKYREGNSTRMKQYHIGDTTYCARKSWIPYVFPRENNPDVYDIDNFMRGLGLEHSVVEVLNYMFTDGQFQMDILFDDITGHPDFVADNKVFEIKATNSTTPLSLDSDKIKSYLRQVVYYMLLTNMREGKIIIKYSLPFFLERVQKRKPKNDDRHYYVRWHQEKEVIPWFCIGLEISEDEPLRHNIRWILAKKLKPLYDYVLKNRDLTVVPVLPGKKTMPMDIKCSMCKVRKICDMIPDRQEDPELRSLLLNEHIDRIIERQYPQSSISNEIQDQENNTKDQQ